MSSNFQLDIENFGYYNGQVMAGTYMVQMLKTKCVPALHLLTAAT